MKLTRNSLCSFLSTVVLAAGILIAAGCFPEIKPPPSSMGLYPRSFTNTALGEKIRFFTTTRMFDFTYDEVFEAANTAVMRLGLSRETKDYENGFLTGSGFWPRPCLPNVSSTARLAATWAIYLESVSPEETRVVVRLDAHPGACTDRGIVQGHLEEIPTAISQVLATYL